ncbi:hypothetical protein JQ636_22530 [Bradyrhizobium japonicum]|uniref:hypothetical protein n=1 Tax=Bradyrhizobium japonicum TaxID=375 RepID=UPI0012FE1348|nr:hypothetical protein [Bradyrhizobium japonicum]MBR0730505.1 hypothetical protein [Bradyrhizobium japonicum]MBR0806336.1 hypothetical protein [Bradyrhizobium japonicum]
MALPATISASFPSVGTAAAVLAAIDTSSVPAKNHERGPDPRVGSTNACCRQIVSAMDTNELAWLLNSIAYNFYILLKN